MELELKSGQTESLFTFAKNIVRSRWDAGLGNLSKAARGYRLAQNHVSDPVLHFDLVSTEPKQTVEECFIQSLEHRLSHWHYHEQLYTECESVEALEQIDYAIGFTHNYFMFMVALFRVSKFFIAPETFKWLEEELSWIKQLQFLNDLTKNRVIHTKKA